MQKIFANRATCPPATTSDAERVTVWCFELTKFIIFFILLVSFIRKLPFYDLKLTPIDLIKKLFTTNHFTTCWTVGFNRNILNKFISETDFESISTGLVTSISAILR